MIGRKYELLQTVLSGGGILVAALVHSLPAAVALAAAVVVAGVGHVGWAWRRERAWRSAFEEEQKELRWMLVPGPGA